VRAQWSQQPPGQSQWKSGNNGQDGRASRNCTQSNNGCIPNGQNGEEPSRNYQSSQGTCHAIIEYPSRMELNVEGDDCDQNGMLSGHQKIELTVDLPVRSNVTFTFDSFFVAGKLHGQTKIQTDAGLSFVGQMYEGGRAVGRTIAFDGSIIEGETWNGFKNLTGTLSAPVHRGGQVDYFVAGESVSREVYEARPKAAAPVVAATKRTSPFGEMLKRVIVGNLVDCLRGGCQAEMAAARAADERKLQERRDADAYAEQQTRIAEGQRRANAARQEGVASWQRQQAEDRQRGLDAIEDARRKQLAGLDRNGSPLPEPTLPARSDTATSNNGSTSSQSGGYQSGNNGRPSSSSSYCSDGSASCSSASGNSSGTSATQGDSSFSGDAKPPAPEFRVDTNRPAEQPSGNNGLAAGGSGSASGNNGRDFTADTSPQGNPPVVTTAPSALPAPILPSTTEPVAPAAEASQLPPPNAPPVQPVAQNDTLKAGPAPSNPVPQNNPTVSSGQQIGPANPNQQPNDTNATQFYGSTPAAYASQMSASDIALNNRLSPSDPQRIENQMSPSQLGQIVTSGQIAGWRAEAQVAVNRQSGVQTAGNANNVGASSGGGLVTTVPITPSETYPGYPTEQSAIVFADNTPTLGWSSVAGVTYYQVAARNLGTGLLEINEPVSSSTFTPSRALPPGQLFRWNVMACNGSGCSAPSVSKYFRTGGAGVAGQTDSGNFATGAAQAAFDANLECAKGIAARTGQSVASVSQWVTSLSWQGVINGTASGLRTFWNHPWVATKAVASGIWNGGLAGAKASYQQFVGTVSRSYQPEQAFELCSNATQAAVTTVGAVDGARGVASASGGGFVALKRLVDRPTGLADDLQNAAPRSAGLSLVYYRGTTVYRKDARPTSLIFSSGFKPLGASADLRSYVTRNTPSIFVGTSKSRGVAADHSGWRGYVYEIDATKVRGVDVNATLGDHRFSGEFEVAIEGGVPASSIKGSWKITSDGTYGPYEINVNYR
jgi:hypothetical protein